MTLESNWLKPGERFDHLIREKIDIIQHPDVFAFSMDAVLLADFAQLPKRPRALILDLCSGNGAVGFLMRGKTEAMIHLVELQERLVDMAERTIQANQLQALYKSHMLDVNDLEKQFKPDSVDYITCNPPYFTTNHHEQLHHLTHHQIARHEVYLTFEQLCYRIRRILKTKGKAAFVHRPERLPELLQTLAMNHLAPKKIQLIHPKKDRPANGVLIEVIKDGSLNGLIVLPPRIIHQDNNQYTQEMKELLGI
ncbi:tRNA1(Val) (adenine(37)-N6)-methyltransferase [Atopobacter phocae]|uniref:tRNA1(Val) (adenine(37)-N6)-methyltransferase n=1 Tax=Atopobacter phocae TaxID=136492 RepID=UPI00046F1C85|nr:tRNA1(Val) (adenine(37)-N6)-methyltransferase [Atopobacter phocae]